MHSLLHTHTLSDTHTSMKAAFHFNNNYTHNPFLPCKHFVMPFLTDKVLNCSYCLTHIICPILVFFMFFTKLLHSSTANHSSEERELQPEAAHLLYGRAHAAEM